MQKQTVNHDEIRHWSQKVGARPAKIDHIDAGADKVGLRLDFKGSEDEEILPEKAGKGYITWDEFFKEFEAQQLLFVYEDEPEGADKTTWYRFGKRNVDRTLIEEEKTRKNVMDFTR